MTSESKPAIPQPACGDLAVDEAAPPGGRAAPAAAAGDLEASQPSGSGDDQSSSSPGDQATRQYPNHVYVPGVGPRFAPGNPAGKWQLGRRRPSAKQIRRNLYAGIVETNMRLSAAIAAGEHVDALLYQRSIHLQMMMERKGFAK